MKNTREIFSASETPGAYSKSYLAHLSQLFSSFENEAVTELMDLLFETRKASKTIFIIGNGGSAATASHFANDLLIGPRLSENGFKAISLTDNVPVMTAVGNDMGYDLIFQKQLEPLLTPGDILLAFSASGNSPNLIKAIEFTKSKGNKVVGFSGFDGGKLKELSDISLHFPTEKGEYGPVEDFHMILVHIIGTYIKYSTASEK